jgi:hypothetical protein
MRELIAVHYTKPFLGSDRVIEQENGRKRRKHKLDPSCIDFTEKERQVHQLAVDWRNEFVAHADQRKREQDLELKRD